MNKAKTVGIALFCIMFAAIGASLVFNEVIGEGVEPNLASSFAVAFFALILGAFGVIVVNLRL